MITEEVFNLTLKTVTLTPSCCSDEQGPEHYYSSLLELIKANSDVVVAVGECGLDYERTQFCDVDTEQTYFTKQLELSQACDLPLFLHNRGSASDLVKILSDNKEKMPR